ncbi:MAG: SPFH domain-containing protein [Phycisphaerales bacterium]
MRKTFLFLIAGVIALGFLVYMMTYTVRFHESAVVTTFGRVTDASVVREPGMRFKWPAPVQSVTLYDTRARFLGSKSETQQTADDRQIVVETFVTWKVNDPLLFNQRFNRSGSGAADHFKSAEKVLADMLRSAMSEVSRYKLSDLFTPKLGDSKLPVLESDIMARLRRGPAAEGAAAPVTDANRQADSLESYGVQVLMVGINKVVLPESTTNQVFERMKATMEARAARAESEGQAAELQIRSAAESDAKAIEAFAKLKADTIKNKGEIEASKWLGVMQSDPEFAAFLDKTRLLRDGFGRRVMLVLPTSMFGPDIFDPATLKPLMERPAQPAGTKPAATPASDASKPAAETASTDADTKTAATAEAR